MNNQSSKLIKFKEFALTIAQKTRSISRERLAQEVWGTSELFDCLEQISTMASKLEVKATSPVAIGIVGEFSSGKTLLQGSLVGYANALPVSEQATTGNVTAIYIEPQEQLKTTEFSKFKVTYLEKKEVASCYKYMLQETQKKAQAAGLELKNISNFNQVIDSLKFLWNSTQDPDLRFSIRELVEFLRVTYAYGKALYKKSYLIRAETVREGLKLPDFPQNLQSQAFENLPETPTILPKAPQRLTPELLKRSFPLIKRIELNVKVSQQIWDLSPLEGVSKFTLLDFPGLGAANSGMRDTFLSLQELDEVETILIVLNGKHPGRSDANKLFTMMQDNHQGDIRDRILVGIGRFDQLPIDSDNGAIIIENLINQEAELTEALLLNQLKPLQTVISNAKAFTSENKRILFLSPLLGLIHLSQLSSMIKVGSEDFLANLNYQQQAKSVQEKWKKISDKLLASNSHSDLGKKLADLSKDGGIDRLRTVIVNHVREHGVKQLEEATEAIYLELRSQQERLKNILEANQAQGLYYQKPENLTKLEVSIKNIIQKFNGFAGELDKQSLQNRQGVDLSTIVKREVISEVNNWPYWNLLFSRVKNGKIPKIESKKPGGITDTLYGKSREQENVYPSKSEDFFKIFTETIAKLEGFVKQTIEECLSYLLSRLSNDLAEERNYLTTIIGSKTGYEANLLSKASDPQKYWLELIIQNDDVNFTSGVIQSETIFPLPRGDENNINGYLFPWHTQGTDTNQNNHQILLSQIRNNIDNSASLHLVELANQLNKKVYDLLRETIKTTIELLQELYQNEESLRSLITTEENNQDHTSSILVQKLADIAEFSLTD